MTRRIVQVATTDKRVYMLCNDGTAWELWDGVFSRISDIPQDEPAEPDPIAEIEALGGRLTVVYDIVTDAYQLWWFLDAATQEVISDVVGGVHVSDLRAAAARLLARVRGAK